MARSAHEMSSSHSVPPRVYLKCSQCRKDGKKCEVDTSKPDPAVLCRPRKCRRCTKLGHECGPRVRAHRQALNYDSSSSTDVLQARRGDVTLPKGITLDGLYRNRAALSIVECLTVQRLLFRRQCELLPASRRLPGDPILEEHRDIVKILNSKLNLLGQSAVRDWRNSFNALKRGDSSAGLLEFHNLQLMFEVGQWRCKWIDNNWQNTTVACDVFSTNTQHSLPLSYEPEFVACTKQIMRYIDPATLQLIEDHELNGSIDASKYLTAQSQLQEIFEPLSAGDMDRSQEASHFELDRDGNEIRCVFFPAAHIAFWNGDKAAALKLSTQGKDPYFPKNIFNENLLHLAAKAGDSNFLNQLLQIDSERVALECISKGVYSALDIATYMDDCDMFNSIIGNCVGVSEWTSSLLHVAIRARSQNVLEIILQRRDIFAPLYTEALRTAIRVGAEDIAQQMIPLLLPYDTSFSEIKSLTEQAEQVGLEIIAHELRFLQPISETWINDQTFRDLQQWEALLSTENTVFMASGLNGTRSSAPNSQYCHGNPQSSQYGKLGDQYV